MFCSYLFTNIFPVCSIFAHRLQNSLTWINHCFKLVLYDTLWVDKYILHEAMFRLWREFKGQKENHSLLDTVSYWFMTAIIYLCTYFVHPCTQTFVIVYDVTQRVSLEGMNITNLGEINQCSVQRNISLWAM